MGTGEIDLLGMLDVYYNDLSLTFWPSEFDHFLKVGHGGTCNPSTGEVRSWSSLELSWCRQEVLWAMFSLALRFSSVLWMFPSSLLLAAVCYLGQDYPVSLADICLQGGGSREDRGNNRRNDCRQIHDALPNWAGGLKTWIPSSQLWGIAENQLKQG